MTVEELIAELQKHDPKLPVYFMDHDREYCDEGLLEFVNDVQQVSCLNRKPGFSDSELISRDMVLLETSY
jgi:hypothetical protein